MERKQETFDWSRAAQLALLRDVQCGDVSVACGRRQIKVKAVNLKAVLRQIDDYAREAGECYAAQQTLADKTGLSRETTKRVLKALVERSLVTCELKRNPLGVVTNHYRIVWNELQLLINKFNEPAPLPAPCLCASVVPSPAGAESTDSSPHETDSSPHETDSSPVTPKPHLNAMKRKTPSPTPSLFDPPAAAPVIDPSEWQEVEEAVAAQGVEDWHTAVDAVRKRRVPPAKVLKLISFFVQHRAANDWGPGVLYRRLMNEANGREVTDHWPVVTASPAPAPLMPAGSPGMPGSGTAASKPTRCRGDAVDPVQMRQQCADARERVQQEQAQLGDLDRDFGPVLDALSDADRDDLAAAAFADSPMLQRMYVKRRSWQAMGMVREGLLEHLRDHGARS